MLLYGSLIIFFVASCSTVALPVPDIPPYLKICHRSDPHLNDCIKESIKTLKPYLGNGIPSLRIPPCEPLHVDEVEINQFSGPIYIHAKYSNISIYGGTNIVPKTIKLDLDKDRMRLKFFIPWLEMIAHYHLNGRIMMLPMVGSGLGHGNFTDIDVIITLQMERYQSQKTGQVHQRVSDIYVDFVIGHATVKLDDLFDGDSTLSAAMNLFLNDNWRSIVAEIKPKLEETIGDLIKDFTDKIFSEFPEDVLLPP
ncbi:protein takeout-like [Hylaeus volcanicus]|uniref:protein takeout-like n=1 Tax=Hylaeus volcanicus TaxID=313075 RepID=UPI0023B80C90|nr:protein takeout-like [Hylaeus volcanicus]